jgi:4'-phosphopantetheinyl transferase
MSRPFIAESMNISAVGFHVASPRELPKDEVHLWRVDLDALRSEEPRWQEVLSAEEAARAGRFNFTVDRQRFVTTRALLKSILGSYLAADANGLSFSYSKTEKPSLAGPHAESGISFNVSHSRGVALLAFTLRREIGVDVEQVRSDFEIDAIARRFFSQHEQQQLNAVPAGKRFEAFFRCWTRKESYIKATGDGLSLPLDQFDVSIAAGDRNALIATRPDGSEAARWGLCEVSAGEGYAAALCVRGTDWKLKSWRECGENDHAVPAC